MKRDMDLVRDILLMVERAERALPVGAFYDLRASRELVDYHLELLIAHGFLDGTLHGSWGSRVIGGSIDGLTWDGQDFLEAVRDDGVWGSVRRAVRDTVGSTTFDVTKSVSVAVAESMIKSHLGV